MEELTGRQREILHFIVRQTEERGFPPTIREIGEEMDIRSTNGVNDHLMALTVLSRSCGASPEQVPQPRATPASAISPVRIRQGQRHEPDPPSGVHSCPRRT